MSSTEDTRLYIIDPSGRQWEMWLDSEPALRRLLPGIAKAVVLPPSLNYKLIDSESNVELDLDRSCRDQAVRSSASIRLVPVADQNLEDKIASLRQQADLLREHGYPREAQARIDDIVRLKPDYIDWPRPQLRTVNVTSGEGSAGLPRITVDDQPRAMTRTGNGTDDGCWVVVAMIVLAVIGLALVWLAGSSSDNEATGAAPSVGGEGDPVGTQIAAAPRTGDLQFTLSWDAAADLDLYVLDPFGDIVSTAIPVIRSGGRLLGDGNSVCLSEPGVLRQETIVWDGAGAPAGEYQFWVVWAGSCGAAAPVPFEIVVTAGDERLGTGPGQIDQPGGSSTARSVDR